jgi:hypothetical protein
MIRDEFQQEKNQTRAENCRRYAVTRNKFENLNVGHYVNKSLEVMQKIRWCQGKKCKTNNYK